MREEIEMYVELHFDDIYVPYENRDDWAEYLDTIADEIENSGREDIEQAAIDARWEYQCAVEANYPD